MRPVNLSGLSLLIIEDDTLLRKQITAHLERLEADVTGVSTLQEAERLLGDLNLDFALLDVNLPDGSGLDLLRRHVFPATMGVVVMTGDGAVAGAVEAMRLGALDYLVKPFDLAELPLVLKRAGQRRQSARLNEHQRTCARDSVSEFFFGQSLAEVERTLGKILEADARMERYLPPVLIQGETGTGKTTIARWLHHRGPRAESPLVEMNCSALPETLAESELFGHERGAFTDAHAARIGLFEAADGGTLFLDELPSLSFPLQAKVLKVIEDHRIRRLGGRKEIPVDVRVVAATSADLRDLVRAGQFREDLYHRLDLYRVRLPPLRERGDDIIGLAERVIERLALRHRLRGKRLAHSAHKRIREYPWPGNVRELAHEIERALVFEDESEIQLRHLAGGGVEDVGRSRSPHDWFNAAYVFPEQGFQLDQAIRRLIDHALGQSGNNVSAAARLLGVSRDYLRYRLEQR